MAGETGAGVRLGGRSIVFQQLALALAAGCQRVACIAHSPSAELAALQRAAEARGAMFHALPHHRLLSGIVRAADEVLAVAPGLVADPDWVREKLADRTGIAILPESAIERGYERIDRDSAWAGVLVVPGDTVELLTQLPADFDPLGGLLRIGLQRGTRTIPVPSEWLDQGRWTLVSDQTTADALEAGWYAARVPGPPFARPLAATAHRIARRMMRRFADRPWLPPVVGLGGAALAIGGAVAGLTGYTTAGLALAAAGAFTIAVWRSLTSFVEVATGARLRPQWAMAAGVMIDTALFAIASGTSGGHPWLAPFAMAVVIGVIRLALEDDAPRVIRPFGDRTLVIAALAIASGFGWLAEAAAGIGTIGLAIRLLAPRPRS